LNVLTVFVNRKFQDINRIRLIEDKKGCTAGDGVVMKQQFVEQRDFGDDYMFKTKTDLKEETLLTFQLKQENILNLQMRGFETTGK